MFEFEVRDLREGDEFTEDDGRTWHTVVAVQRSSTNEFGQPAGSPTTVIYTDEGEMFMPSDQLVIVK